MDLEQLFRVDGDGKDRLCNLAGKDLTDEIVQVSGPRLVHYTAIDAENAEESRLHNIDLESPENAKYYEQSCSAAVHRSEINMHTIAVVFYGIKE